MEAAKRKKNEREKYRDRIRGSLLVGAVGDALVVDESGGTAGFQ